MERPSPRMIFASSGCRSLPGRLGGRWRVVAEDGLHAVVAQRAGLGDVETRGGVGDQREAGCERRVAALRAAGVAGRGALGWRRGDSQPAIIRRSGAETGRAEKITAVAEPASCPVLLMQSGLSSLQWREAKVHAGVDDDELAGDVAAFGAGEEEDRFGDVFRLRGDFQRRGLDDAFGGLRPRPASPGIS